MHPQKGIVPAFAGIARAILPVMRGAISTKCHAAPSLANSMVQRSNIRRIGTLRGGAGGNAADASSTALRASDAAAIREDLAVMNPLLASDDFPLYDQVKSEHIMPGMKALILEAETTLALLEARLVQNKYDIKCAELLSELERMSDRIGRAWGVVNHLKGVKDNEALRNAVEAVQPSVVAFNLKTSQSEALYKAFKALKDGPQFANLSPAQKRIIENEIRDAQLSGVALEGEKKARFNAIQQELAKLSNTYSNNVLDSTKIFTVRITMKEEVAGLPESALGLASQTAVSKGDKDSTPEKGPWVFTLDAPSFLPVQQHAKNRNLRERVYEQYITRASEKTVAKESKIGEILGAMKDGQVGKRQGLGMLVKRVAEKIGMSKSKSLDNTVPMSPRTIIHKVFISEPPEFPACFCPCTALFVFL